MYSTIQKYLVCNLICQACLCTLRAEWGQVSYITIHFSYTVHFTLLLRLLPIKMLKNQQKPPLWKKMVSLTFEIILLIVWKILERKYIWNLNENESSLNTEHQFDDPPQACLQNHISDKPEYEIWKGCLTRCGLVEYRVVGYVWVSGSILWDFIKFLRLWLRQ